MSSFANRVVQAALLNPGIYEEIEADFSARALLQALVVVLLSGIAAGIGTSRNFDLQPIVMMSAASVISWSIWALITMVIGTRLFAQPQTQTDYEEMLRVLGFSASPGFLRILGILPGFGGLILLISEIWMFAAMIIALRQALDYTSTLRAFGVCIVGWIVQLVLIALPLYLIGNMRGF